MAKKEELTTEMHSEFIGNEISQFDLKVMGVFGATARGYSLEDALKKYGFSERGYNENVKRVMGSEE